MSTRGGACLIGVATALLMLLTEPSMAIVWDEGYTLGRQERLRLWFQALRDPQEFADSWRPPAVELVQQVGAPPPRADQIDTRTKLLTDPLILAWFWPFAREEPHGHPPFYALVGLLGDLVNPGRPPLPRARLGPILAFSVIAGALFGFMSKRWGIWSGTVAAGAWVLQPNLFAHGHYATYDALLSALWLGCLMAFVLAIEGPAEGKSSVTRRPRWGWVVLFGLLLGFAFDTKLTGWFLPVPFLAWVGLTRNAKGFRVLILGGLLGLVVVYGLNPPWWTEPVAGLTRFFGSNLDRARSIPIQTLFLGKVYSTPDGSLPWYNTLFWTAIVTPIGFLALGLIGLGRGLVRWRTEPIGLLLVTHWVFLMMLRALPHTPGHDGVRQILPAFGLLAMLAGPGTTSTLARLGRWGKAIAIGALSEAVVSVGVMMPVPLSYFSPIVGGLPGATALGMEPTYYWDALDSQSLGWLRDQTGPGQKVRFATFPTSWLYLKQQGVLPPGLLPNDSGVWAWYVLQNRPGALNPVDRALIREGKPSRVVTKLGVPLLWIYPFDQVERFLRSGPESATPTPHSLGRE